MKLHTVLVLVTILGACCSIPIYQQQIGLLASNSNELLRLNGMTLAGVGFGQAQTSSFLPFVLQQQPDLAQQPQLVAFNPQAFNPQGFNPQGFNPQAFNPQAFNPQAFNPQMTGSFLPQGPPMLLPGQGNQLPPILFPPSQQEQPASPQDPSNPQQTPQTGQTFPQYYPSLTYPQQTGSQVYPFYMSYGYPQRQPTAGMQPTLNNGQQNQQNLDRTNQKPQLPLQIGKPNGQADMAWGRGTETGPITPPNNRGDNAEPGVDEQGHTGFSFLFEP